MTSASRRTAKLQVAAAASLAAERGWLIPTAAGLQERYVRACGTSGRVRLGGIEVMVSLMRQREPHVVNASWLGGVSPARLCFLCDG